MLRRWVPGTAKFVALGEYARNTGCLQVETVEPTVSRFYGTLLTPVQFTLQIFELRGNQLQKVQEIEKQARFKCGTFGASSLSERQLATGSFQGELQVRL